MSADSKKLQGDTASNTQLNEQEQNRLLSGLLRSLIEEQLKSSPICPPQASEPSTAEATV